MRHRLFTCFLFALTLSGRPAWADSLLTLSGDLTNGGTFQGSLRLDTGGEAFVQGTYTNGADSFTLPPNYLGEQLGEGTFTTVDVFSVNQSYDLFLILPEASLVGYTGGNLCALYSSCFPAVRSYSSFQENSFSLPSNFLHLTATPATPATPATTPEPASLTLLGTGSLVLAATLRKRCPH